MNFLRNHWYDIGGLLAVATLLYVGLNFPFFSDYQLLMWLSLASLFLHQLEEYRIPGTFPGMINRVMFNSKLPHKYPLNSNTSFIINVGLGWVIYFLAAVAGENHLWLGITSILISLGNSIAHTFIFNIRGKTIYNAGLVSCWLFFAPVVYYFVRLIAEGNVATTLDYFIGIPLGILINVFGVFKLISWLADKNSTYTFLPRNLLLNDRKG